MKKNSFFLLFCTFLHPLFAQISTPAATAAGPVLTPDEAVRLALERNFDIRLSRADADIARINNTKGNAGMLPAVNLVAADNLSVNAFQQQRLADGRSFDAYGALSNNVSAGVQLNWTLFDGRRTYIAKKRLEEIEKLGLINLQNTVQQTTAEVLQTYYEVVRGRLQERALNEVIALNEERLRIADARLAAGMAAQTDALQARIDLNQRRADLLGQQYATTAAKRALNRLLARPAETPFEVVETMENTYAPLRAELLQKMQAQNPALLSLQKNAEVAALVADENRTLNKARIVGIGQVNALRTDNAASLIQNNTQAGLTLGASLVYPLYTAGNYRRQLETAQLQAQQAVIQLDAQRLTVEAELDNQLAFFQIQQQGLALEEENVKNARENLNVSTERFRLGQTDALETQVAQNTLEQSLFRRNLALYELKATELRLRLLAGEL